MHAEAILKWWSLRPIRDKRALIILALFLPSLIFWHLVTVPLRERLEKARRVLNTRRAQAEEVKKKLDLYVQLRTVSADNRFKASADVLSVIESFILQLDINRESLILNRSVLSIKGQKFPAAQIVIDRIKPSDLFSLLKAVTKAKVKLAELEISANPHNGTFSGLMRAWLPQ